MRTRRGELSINAGTLEILAKTFVPIPLGKEMGEQAFSWRNDSETGSVRMKGIQ
ncbi:hypothetical protein ACFLQ0_03495 [Nitrospinota bacterium]